MGAQVFSAPSQQVATEYQWRGNRKEKQKRERGRERREERKGRKEGGERREGG